MCCRHGLAALVLLVLWHDHSTRAFTFVQCESLQRRGPSILQHLTRNHVWAFRRFQRPTKLGGGLPICSANSNGEIEREVQDAGRKQTSDRKPIQATAARRKRSGGARPGSTGRSRPQRNHGRNGGDMRKSVPDLRECESVAAVLDVHRDCGKHMSPFHLSTCWNRIATLVATKREERHLKRHQNELKSLLKQTTQNMNRFGPKPLSTATRALAKISSVTGWDAGPTTWASLQERAELVIGDCDPQGVSNILWAFAKVSYFSPELFDAGAKAALSKLNGFTPQGITNTAWAYATAGHSAPVLFESIAELSVSKLSRFNPQDLANMAWAYATTGHSAPALFESIAELSVSKLSRFNPQDLASMAWAYARAGHSSPVLFESIAEASVPKLDQFKAQNLANVAWAYATAGHSSTVLFDSIADASIGKLGHFNPQDLANVAWAYATAGHSATVLFDSIADASIPNLNNFNPQQLANIAWANAMMGHAAPALFDSIGKMAALQLDHFDEQALANIVWAFAALDHWSDTLSATSPALIDACVAKSLNFSVEGMCQLHQWFLWHQEKNVDLEQLSDLREKCRDAFMKEPGCPSKLQKDVVSTLSDLGLQPQEEVLTEIGYSLDALVTFRGHEVGLEVDGPSHFINRSPTGSTIIKRRQLATLANLTLLSVPYWEWNLLACKKESALSSRQRRQKYLLEGLERAVTERGTAL